MIPYSGTIGARVVDLRPGYARLTLADRRRVRNHLRSIHAVALLNLGEITTGLAVFSTTSTAMRGILVEIRAEYLKKARGKLVSSAEFSLPETLADNIACKVEARIEDQAGDTVSIVTATWLLGYRPT
jgi:acyl-coenzyme A thioesterase PaaI-like protein